MKFAEFIENNDHEGETWRFWLQVDGNEAALVELDEILTPDEFDAEFEITGVKATESEVDTLVKYTMGDYMALDNKVTGELRLPDSLRDVDKYGNPEYVEVLYKGGITDLFK